MERELVLTLEEARSVLSEITTHKNRYQKEGMDGTAAWAQANAELSRERNIPDVGKEAMRTCRAKQTADFWAKLTEEETTVIGDNGRPVITKGWCALYLQWVEEHDYLPKDSFCALLTGATPAAFSYARRKLIEHGYEFESTPWGWLVTKRPPPPPPPPAPVPAEPEPTHPQPDLEILQGEFQAFKELASGLVAQFAEMIDRLNEEPTAT